MKATINGITVEGTPQEIMEYQRLQNNEQKQIYPHFDQWYPPDTLVPRVTGEGTSNTPYWMKYIRQTTQSYT